MNKSYTGLAAVVSFVAGMVLYGAVCSREVDNLKDRQTELVRRLDALEGNQRSDADRLAGLERNTAGIALTTIKLMGDMPVSFGDRVIPRASVSLANASFEDFKRVSCMAPYVFLTDRSSVEITVNCPESGFEDIIYNNDSGRGRINYSLRKHPERFKQEGNVITVTADLDIGQNRPEVLVVPKLVQGKPAEFSQQYCPHEIFRAESFDQAQRTTLGHFISDSAVKAAWEELEKDKD